MPESSSASPFAGIIEHGDDQRRRNDHLGPRKTRAMPPPTPHGANSCAVSAASGTPSATPIFRQNRDAITFRRARTAHGVTGSRWPAALLGLRDSITMDVAFPNRTGEGDPAGPNLWEFNPDRVATLTGAPLPECTAETGTGQGYRLDQGRLPRRGVRGAVPPHPLRQAGRPHRQQRERRHPAHAERPRQGRSAARCRTADRPDLYPDDADLRSRDRRAERS